MSAIVKNFDLSGIRRKLERMGVAVQKPLQALIMEQAKLCISSTGNVPGLAQLLPPAHEGVKGAAAGRHGKAKVAADIARVYATPARAYAEIRDQNPAAAKAFWCAVYGRSARTKSGRYKKNTRGTANLEEARRLLRENGGAWSSLDLMEHLDGGALHKAARDDRGNVRKGRRPSAIIVHAEELTAYVKQKQDNVGLLMSVLNQPGSMLGAKGIPTFARQHGNKMGAPLQILTTARSFHVVIDLSAPYGVEYITHRIPYILRYREAALQRSWPYVKRWIASQQTALAA